jgi:hypothetical protein
MELTINLALKKRENKGFVLGRNFSVESNRRLNISEVAKTRLMIEDSVCDRLLLEELLLCDSL